MCKIKTIVYIQPYYVGVELTFFLYLAIVAEENLKGEHSLTFRGHEVETFWMGMLALRRQKTTRRGVDRCRGIDWIDWG